MPIPFILIPKHIRLSIVEKQDVCDFVRFSMCSRKTYDLSLQVRTQFSLVVKQDTKLKCTGMGKLYFQYVDVWSKTDSNRKIFEENLKNVPVRVLFKDVAAYGFAENKCTWLKHFLLNTGSYIYFLQITEISCSPGALGGLFETGRVSEVLTKGRISQDFLQSPAIRKLDGFGLDDTDFTDYDFLALKNKTIAFFEPCVSASAINTFLKEWVNGDRIIKEAFIAISRGTRIKAIFKDLPFTTASYKKMKRYRLRNKENSLIDIGFDLVDYMEIFRLD